MANTLIKISLRGMVCRIKSGLTRNIMSAQIPLMLGAFFLVQPAFADSQTRYPTGDNSATATWTLNPSSPASRYVKVYEAVADDETSYIYATTTGNTMFSFDAFSVPAGSTITDLTVYYRHKKTAAQTCNISASIRVNGANYDSTDPGVNPTNGTWITDSYSYAVNPDSGTQWTVDDINGTGANPLQAFGVYTGDASPNPYVTQVYAVITYTPSGGGGGGAQVPAENTVLFVAVCLGILVYGSMKNQKRRNNPKK